MEPENKKKSTTNWLATISVSLMLTAILCLLAFFMHGETTIVSDYDGAETLERLVCESNLTSYPIFNDNGTDGRLIKVNALFGGKKIISISLIYKIYYSSQDEINRSEAVNHAAMNISFREQGLNPDSYEANYSKLEDGLQLSLYANEDDIDNRAWKYFMLDELNGNLYTPEKVATIYNNQGLDCKIRKNNE